MQPSEYELMLWEDACAMRDALQELVRDDWDARAKLAGIGGL